MKPLLHPYSVLFFRLFIFISINIPTSLCTNHSQYRNCSNSFSCGNSVSELKYPFWGGNRNRYCGKPNLELKCEGSVPKITINSIKYRVLLWDSTTQTLILARDDYWDNICVSDIKNNTFDNTPFQYNGALENVTLFYDCASSPNLPDMFEVNCSAGKIVYYVLGFSYSLFCTNVVFPIFATQASFVSGNRSINYALDVGFGLKWMGNYEECNTCIASLGECGFDDGGFICFCKDGPRSTSCASQTSRM
ncbi:hypothetical protein VNO77_21657 [Canavalia gladiata]|uniref:non-specific serine/threonine protein kinase n=1 Tax=Canavalia gladiata TaxID=3824 RepID=A0AAN9QMC1_CANGL